MSSSSYTIVLLTLVILFVVIVAVTLIYLFLYGPFKKKQDPAVIDLNEINSKNYIYKVIPHFLSHENCDTLIRLAQTRGFSASLVRDNQVDTDFRKSETCWLSPSEYPLVYNLYEQIYKFTGYVYPISNYESLQIVRYTAGGMFSQHHDQCNPLDAYCQSEMNRLNGYRLLTIMIALNDNYAGGGTWFPYYQQLVKLRKGDAIIFQNVLPTAFGSCKIDPRSIHEGVPVTNGERFIANIWIRGECSSVPYFT